MLAKPLSTHKSFATTALIEHARNRAMRYFEAGKGIWSLTINQGKIASSAGKKALNACILLLLVWNIKFDYGHSKSLSGS